ncbi:MAG: N-acetylmuramoyl-L-alanine amidase [Clostridium fessum]
MRANAVYTRSTDVYDTPYQKAEMGNEAGADYFVSLHRNAASEPGKVRASWRWCTRQAGNQNSWRIQYKESWRAPDMWISA